MRYKWRILQEGSLPLRPSGRENQVPTREHAIVTDPWIPVLLENGKRRSESGAADSLRSFEGRFRRLLACTAPEEICRFLPGVFRLAERREIAIDLRQFYWDLKQWEKPESTIKVKWAADFWGSGSRERAQHAGSSEGDTP